MVFHARSILMFVLLFLAGCGGDDVGNEKPVATTPKDAPELKVPKPAPEQGPRGDENLSDEQATVIVRKLLVAMTEQDEKAVLALIVPDANAEVLWKGERLPQPQFDTLLEYAKRTNARRVQLGETIKSGSRDLKITPELSTDERPYFVITRDGKETGLPLWMKRVDGTWRADMSVVIMARQMAIEKARQLEKLSPKGPKPPQ